MNLEIGAMYQRSCNDGCGAQILPLLLVGTFVAYSPLIHT
jgi:hypothetical protein